MRRCLFNFAAAVSLALCLAMVVLWVRSDWVPESLTRYTMREDAEWVWGRELVFWSDSGRITTGVVDQGASPAQKEMTELEYRSWVAGGWRWVRGQDWQVNSYDPFLIPQQTGTLTSSPFLTIHSSHHEFLGFRIGTNDLTKATPRQFHMMRLVTIPYWFLALVLIALPAIWSISTIRTRHRKKGGRCLACGYNLTGNTSGVCPECGTPVARKSEADA